MCDDDDDDRDQQDDKPRRGDYRWDDRGCPGWGN